MSDQKIAEFRDEVLRATQCPDFAGIERRGRVRRLRRAVPVAALAAVLAGTAWVSFDDDRPRAVEPVTPTDELPPGTAAYPGNVMETLEPGTYQLEASSNPDHLVARFTVPAGWNAWEGPNKFDGIGSFPTNEEALGQLTWYAGLLVLEVNGVTSRLCTNPYYGDEVESTPAALVEALQRIPGWDVVQGPETATQLSHPATHLRLRAEGEAATCEHSLFNTSKYGFIGGASDGPLDLWVVDVEGDPMLVASSWTDTTPAPVRRELAAIVDSIEFAVTGARP